MKIRVIKKMMAYLLVGAMVLSTPMTASATEPSIADVYTDTDDGGGSGTLSGSSTGTSTDRFNDTLGEDGVQAQVLGLALDKNSLSLEVNGDIASDKLQARVLFNDYDPKDEEMVLAANAETKEVIDKFLRWQVLNNENKVVGLTYYDKPDGSKDYSMVNVNAKNGGKVTVQAYIDYNGNHKLDNGEFHAEATVSVKQLADSIEFVKMPENFYLKRKYDLNKYIKVNPSTATCDVSFYVGSADAKKVTISDDGIMTVKKLTKKDTPESIKLYAVTENNNKTEVDITLHPGVPAKEVIISSDNGNILDHGKIKTKDMTKATLTADLKPKASGVVTDDVEWTVKQPKTPVIEINPKSSENDDRTLWADIKAVGVGTATVTAKASSGKKSTFKITVNSTPFGIEVTDIETWTGAKPSLTAVLYADDYKENSDGSITGTPIQVGKTKVSYRALKGNAKEPDSAATNPKNIKVNAKGVVTSSNLLVDATKQKTPIDADNRTIEVTAKYKDGTNKTLTTKCNVKVKQADIKNITVTDMTYITSEKPDGKLVTFGGKKQDSASASAVSGGKYTYKAFAFADEANKTPAPQYNEAIVWASSSAKVGTIAVDKANESGNYGKLSVLKGGTTKVTASYVTVNEKNGKKSAKLNKKTITVKAVQKATSLTLNKNIFTVVAGTNAKPVAINVKKQLPSGSKDKITWKVVAGDKNGEMLINDEGKTWKNVKPANAKTTSVKIPVSQYDAGTVVKVGAYADGGAVAYAYIYVVDSKTKGVQVVKGKSKTTKETMTVGQSIKLVPQIKKSDNSFHDALNYTKENKGYASDPVTYSFNKAGIASIDKDGNITAMKPGTTKLTVKTLSGKKATVTITVK
ncbi:MAG: hypothetical protein K1W27_08500 [Lachnospiraceae bacterium]